MKTSRWHRATELPPDARRRVTWMVRAAAGADLAAGAGLVLAANQVIEGGAWVQLATGGLAAALAVTLLGGAALATAEPGEVTAHTRVTRPTR